MVNMYYHDGDEDYQIDDNLSVWSDDSSDNTKENSNQEWEDEEDEEEGEDDEYEE